jgi:hypothetical protein
MSSLIILHWLARLKGEYFNLNRYVEEFKCQWLRRGIDPLTLEKKKTGI